MSTSVKYVLTLCVIAGMLATCGKKENSGAPQDSTTAPQDTAMEYDDSGEFEEYDESDPDTSMTASAYVFFNIDSIRGVLDAGKHLIDQELTDPAKTKGFIHRLPKNDPASIPYAIHYIQHHPAPAGSATYDTLYKEFINLHYLVSVAYSRVVGSATLAPLLERPDHDDAEQKNLYEYLALYSLTPYSEDGVYYVDAEPRLYSDVFRGKGSLPLQDYISLKQKDRNEDYRNHIYTIYPRLYARIEYWGIFIEKFPDFLLTGDALGEYCSNLRMLLIGDYNSPVFDSETHVLLPELKSLYETIMASDKDHVSKQIITDYYNFLKKNNFKRTDEVNTFLAPYKISSMFKQSV